MYMDREVSARTGIGSIDWHDCIVIGLYDLWAYLRNTGGSQLLLPFFKGEAYFVTHVSNRNKNRPYGWLGESLVQSGGRYNYVLNIMHME